MKKSQWLAIQGMILFCLLFISGATQGQSRKYSNEFLAIGVGARALGMSNAYVSSVDDVTSGYWNPAGLLRVRSNIEIAAMHAEYFAGIAKYDYGSFTTPIDTSSALGFSLIRFGVDDIPNTIDLIDPEGNINYDRIEKFSAADYAFMGSYARKLKVPGLSIGVNAKVIHRIVGDFGKAWGFGIDLGGMYQYEDWRFGLMARDVTTTYNAWSYNIPDNMAEVFSQTGNEIPQNSVEITLPKFILGASRKFIIKEMFSAMPELDADITTDGMRNVLIKSDIFSIDPHFGIEFGFKDFIFLRGGIGNIQKVKSDLGNRNVTIIQPNIGLGLRIKTLTIDWAMTDIGDLSVALYSHIFSLKLDLYKSKQ